MPESADLLEGHSRPAEVGGGVVGGGVRGDLQAHVNDVLQVVGGEVRSGAVPALGVENGERSGGAGRDVSAVALVGGHVALD